MASQVRSSRLSHVCEVMTDPSTVALFPSVIEVHASAAAGRKNANNTNVMKTDIRARGIVDLPRGSRGKFITERVRIAGCPGTGNRKDEKQLTEKFLL
jgi:hypothetical protein